MPKQGYTSITIRDATAQDLEIVRKLLGEKYLSHTVARLAKDKIRSSANNAEAQQ